MRKVKLSHVFFIVQLHTINAKLETTRQGKFIDHIHKNGFFYIFLTIIEPEGHQLVKFLAFYNTLLKLDIKK